MPKVVSREEFVRMIAERRAEKEASRARDAERLANDEISREELQRENSPWPRDFIRNAEILNFNDVIGK